LHGGILFSSSPLVYQIYLGPHSSFFKDLFLICVLWCIQEYLFLFFCSALFLCGLYVLGPRLQASPHLAPLALLLGATQLF